MYHPRFKGTHYEMGVKFGNIIKNSNTRFPIRLDQFQLEHGTKSGKILEQYFPEAYSEIEGIVSVLGINKKEFVAWMMCMGCCLYNLEGIDNLEVRGCTAFSFIEDGTIIYGRDNDLPPFLKEVSKSILYKPHGGYSFLLNTSSFINGEEGINSYGLVVAMTFVMPNLDEINPGFNSVFLVRYILEKCRDVNEGIKVLNELPIASSCNILLTDISGKMVVVECHPREINIREPEHNKSDRVFIITVNHFTSHKMKKYDASLGDGEYNSSKRYNTAYNALMNEKNDDKINFSQNILSGNYGFMCQYKKECNFDTVWSSVFELNTGIVFRAEGNPGKVKYKKDERYIKIIKNSEYEIKPSGDPDSFR